MNRFALASRHFPNISTRAFYAPRCLAVFLPQDEIEEGRNQDEAYLRPWLMARLPVIAHEFQHALDHVGSVAGRALLDKLAGAYFALERKVAGDISEMPRLMALHDAERLFDRKAYFTEIDPDYRWLSETPPVWRWGISTGIGFDHGGVPNPDDPLFFVRFTDVEQNAMIGRQPITTASLFEARAVYAELDQEVNLRLIASHDDPAALEAFRVEQQRTFYASELLLYSAPAHFAASVCTDGDALDAYRIAAYAAGIVLNLAPELTFEPRLHEAYQDEASRSRFERLIASRDPGFLFVLLISWAPRYAGDVLAWLDEALAAAGFPTRETIMAAAVDHLAIPSVHTGAQFDMLYFQAAAGGATNLARMADRMGLLDFETMGAIGTNRAPIALPHIFVRNDWRPSPVEPLVDPEVQLMLIDNAETLASQMAEFVAACR